MTFSFNPGSALIFTFHQNIIRYFIPKFPAYILSCYISAVFDDIVEDRSAHHIFIRRDAGNDRGDFQWMDHERDIGSLSLLAGMGFRCKDNGFFKHGFLLFCGHFYILIINHFYDAVNEGILYFGALK